MSGGCHKDSVYLSTTFVPVLSLRSPRTQAPDMPAEATYPPSRLYPFVRIHGRKLVLHLTRGLVIRRMVTGNDYQELWWGENREVTKL